PQSYSTSRTACLLTTTCPSSPNQQPFPTRRSPDLNETKMMYRLLAIAKYEDRFVIPTSHREQYTDPYRAQGSTGYGFGGDDCDGCGPVMAATTNNKTGKEIYEENFYGGIWRD